MGWHIISKPECPHCTDAKALLTEAGEVFTVDERITPEQIAMFKADGHSTFPRVFLDGELIGGAYELRLHLLDAEEF